MLIPSHFFKVFLMCNQAPFGYGDAGEQRIRSRQVSSGSACLDAPSRHDYWLILQSRQEVSKNMYKPQQGHI